MLRQGENNADVNYIFHRDNISIHCIRHNEVKTPTLDWLANILNLNPMEKVWDIIMCIQYLPKNSQLLHYKAKFKRHGVFCHLYKFETLNNLCSNSTSKVLNPKEAQITCNIPIIY